MAKVTKINEKANTEKELSAADLLGSAADMTPQRLDLPNAGGHIYMRPMTGDEGVQWATLVSEPANKNKQRELLIRFCACDKNGKPLFSASQVEMLGRKSLPTLNAMRDFAAALCGFKTTKGDDLATEKNDSGEAAPVASPTA